MPVVWRLCKRKWARLAFSGIGAADNPGRWNSIGRKAVYCADSRALCALEVLAHVQNKRLLEQAEFVAISVDVPNDLIYHPGKLPANWNRMPVRMTSRRFGDHFLESGRLPVMRVPSAVVEGEFCYLLNPLHPNFPELQVGAAVSFRFDRRVIGRQPKAA